MWKHVWRGCVLSVVAASTWADASDPARPLRSAGPPSGAALGAPPVDRVEDGGFELGTPNAAWNETSTNFGTPICSVALCGNGAGTSLPRSDTFWAWFGGIPAPEVGTVDQDVVIRPGTAILTFYLWNGSAVAGSGAFFRVEVDGNVELTVNDGDAPYTDGYTRVSLDLGAYADGGVHNLLFRGTSSVLGVTNWAVDDITLSVSPSVIDIPTQGEIGRPVLVGALLLAALWVLRRQHG